MKNILIILAICFFKLFPFSVYAEGIQFDRVMNLGVQITGIVQDTNGFFWITTSNGLMRYDGLEIKTWRKNEGSLSEDFIRAICDTDDALWLLTNTQGLNKFDKNTGEFKHYKHDPTSKNSLKGAGGYALFVDKGGFVWVGTANGILSRLDPKTETFIHYRHDPNNPNSLPKGMLTTIYQDLSGLFWIGSEGGGLARFDFESETFTNYKNNPDDPYSLSGNRVNVILEDGGFLWIGTATKGLNRFDKTTDEFIRYQHNEEDPASISHNSVMSICKDGQFLWIGTIHGGLNLFNKQTGTFQRFLNDPKAPDANLTKAIEEIYIDRSNILWILSRTGAILKHDRKTKGFALYRHDPQENGSISSNTILPIYEDKQGTTWIGTANGGLNKYIRKSDTFISFQFNPQDPDSIPAPGVSALAEDNKGTFWVAASDASQGTLAVFDRKTNIFTKQYRHDPKNPDSISNNRFLLDICPDRFNPDILWLAIAFGGLEKFDTKKEIFTHYPGNPDDPAKLAGSYIKIFQDHNGILWLGGNYGFDRFDPVTEKVIRYRHDPVDSKSLIENNVSDIYEDHSGFLWLGTTGGLEKFDKKTQSFTHYTSKTGLPDNNVLGILEDDNGNIWMSTGGGIIKFDPIREKYKLYTKSDGLQGNAFYWFSSCLSSNGEMWFAGFNGANRFHPENIHDNPYIPNIVLTSVKQGGEEVYFGKIPSRLTKLNLGWRTNFFEFEAAALEFTKPEKNQYMYFLEGIDDNWYMAGTNRFGRYTNLPGGSYTLKIKGSNNDGIWNNKALFLEVIVEPPPWKTWWAYSLYLMLLGSTLFSFWRYQHVRLEQEKNKTQGLEKINKIKDEIIANTSHELRTPLHGIIGLGESLLDGAAGPLSKRMEQNLKIIVSSGLRMINLVNDILDFSKLGKKELRLRQRKLDIKIIVDIVLELFKPLSRGKDIQLINAIPANTPPVYADENMINQILNNLIGNAIKFTKTGSVTISSSLDQAFVNIHVTDTGIGIPSHQFDKLFEPFEQVDAGTERSFGGTGLGLAISKKLIELHKGSIGVESQEGKGSHFWFSLPIASAPLDGAEPTGITMQTRITRLADISLETDYGEPYQGLIGTESLTGASKSILVVDDDPINLQVLINQLTLNNYSISQACDGESALAIIEEADHSDRLFDLILLDVMMPKMSGYEVCKKLRKKYSHDRLPIVMLTAKNQINDLVTGFESGANDYLPKPFSKDELLARIKIQFTLSDLAEKRKRAENEIMSINKELKEASQFLEMIIDNANVWLNVLDNEGNVIIWNKTAEEISGYTKDEVVGNNKIWKWSYPEESYREKIQAKAMAIINRGEILENFKTNIRRKDGKERTIAWHSQNLADQDGNPMGSIAFGRDITKIMLLEAQLAQARKMESIGTLAGGIAHDFNNILFPIVGHTEMLIEDLPEDSPFRAGLNEIYSGALRASELVKQILTFSRKENGELKLIKMQPIIKEALKLIRSSIPKTIEIKQNINPECGVIKANPTQIHQIIMNLSTNAYHAMGDTGGELRLNLKELEFKKPDLIKPDLMPGVYACLTVADTGSGMDKALIEKIFEPFFTTKKTGKGTGMGLAVVHGIVKNMNGTIEVYSESGKGTEFHVYLPLAETMKEQLVTNVEAPLQSGTEHILLVDDEKAIIAIEQNMLRRLGYKVTSCSSSIEALEAFRSTPEKFDMVITDMAMPNMSGDKLSEELIKIRPCIPVLLCTGFSETMTEEKAASLGIRGFLLKPIVMKDLSRKVRDILDKN